MRVLDVGCFDERMFARLGDRLGYGVGIDPMLSEPVERSRFRLLRTSFPDGAPDERFDVITMLAVLEHVRPQELSDWIDTCRSLLVPGGRIVASMPAPAVDRILDVLIKLRLLHGMEFGQHHGADPSRTVETFTDRGFTLLRRQRFQAGLNNLIVLQAPAPLDDLAPDQVALS